MNKWPVLFVLLFILFHINCRNNEIYVDTNCQHFSLEEELEHKKRFSRLDTSPVEYRYGSEKFKINQDSLTLVISNVNRGDDVSIFRDEKLIISKTFKRNYFDQFYYFSNKIRKTGNQNSYSVVVNGHKSRKCNLSSKYNYLYLSVREDRITLWGNYSPIPH